MAAADMSEGCWHRVEATGELVWKGPKVWTTRRGRATLRFGDGDLESIDACRLPDGTRGSVHYDVYDFDAPAKREGRSGLGGHRRPGDIAIAAEDVTFVDLPELEEDLLASAHIHARVREGDFADRLYAALCNTQWERDSCNWSTTFREAGRIVARLQGDVSDGAYVRFINHLGVEYGTIREGVVATEVAAELAALGWTWRALPALHPKALTAVANGRRMTIALALGQSICPVS
jgi:hypothetical protein